MFKRVDREWVRAFRILEALEVRGIGQDWKIDGLHIWPIVKTIIVGSLIRSDLIKTPLTTRQKTRRFFGGMLRNIQSATKPSKGQTSNQALAEAITADENSHRQLWCVGNSGTLLAGQTGYAHVHFDPYRVLAERHGLEHWALFYNEPAASARVSDLLIGPNKGISDFFRFPAISPWRTEILKWRAIIADQVGGELRHASIDLAPITEIISVAIEQTLFCRNAFRQTFERRRPRAILCFNYYQRVGWGICAAAREAGIRILEIQHGAQGNFHHAYHWAKVPPEGWNILPHAFLLYGIPSGTAVDGQECYFGAPSWFLWCKLAYLADGPLMPPTKWCDNARQWLLEARRTIWAEAADRTMPWLMYASFPKEELERISKLEASLVGRARNFTKRHPTMSRMDYSQVEKLPLPITMAAMDGLVTGYSAKILEAAAMGLNCYALHDNAWRFYRGLPLSELPEDHIAAANALAATPVSLHKPEDRFLAALERTKFPEGWL